MKKLLKTKEKMQKNKKQKGITLIALVITIVVLIILAGISINLVLGENGLFTKAQKAARDMDIASLKEQIGTELLSMQIENEGNNFAVEESDVEKILSKYGKIIRSEDGNIIGLKPTGKDYEIPFGELWQGETINSYSETKHVNAPKIAGTGLTPVKISDNGAITKTTEDDIEWYNYEQKKWANAQSADGSLWVWIPRYAYKIKYENNDDYSQGGTIDVKFLIGTTDNYEETNTEIGASEEQAQETGNQKTAKRATLDNMKEGGIPVDTRSDYYVHPAFTDESSIGYANGGWDRELTGIWVAKFEAGYEGKTNQPNTAKDSNIIYTTITGNIGIELESNKYYYGVRDEDTKIKYPTFQANKPSYNNISISDAFSLCKILNDSGNPYNLSNKVDSHLMKNSEWGAVVYLAWSSYGQTGTQIRINNVNAYSINTIYGITGYGGYGDSAYPIKIESEDVLKNYLNGTADGNWTTQNKGQLASTTGNITGIYDMSGGNQEIVAAFVNNGNNNLTFGRNLLEETGVIIDENEQIKENSGHSTKYVTIYPCDMENEKTLPNKMENSQKIEAIRKNAKKNTKIFGDGVREVFNVNSNTLMDSESTLCGSWNNDVSHYPCGMYPYFALGAGCSSHVEAGNFAFNHHNGSSQFSFGFRAVLIP